MSLFVHIFTATKPLFMSRCAALVTEIFEAFELEVPEAFLHLHPRLTLGEYVELRKVC